MKGEWVTTTKEVTLRVVSKTWFKIPNRTYLRTVQNTSKHQIQLMILDVLTFLASNAHVHVRLLANIKPVTIKSASWKTHQSRPCTQLGTKSCPSRARKISPLIDRLWNGSTRVHYGMEKPGSFHKRPSVERWTKPLKFGAMLEYPFHKRKCWILSVKLYFPWTY